MHVCPECGTATEPPGYCTADGHLLVAATDPLLGTEVLRYRIARLLGEGGMGKVYLAVQPSLGSRVAIKVLSAQCAESPELLERFFAEGRAVNLIRHENIISIFDLALLPDGRPLIVMEYVDGQTLTRLIRGGRAPLDVVVRVMGEVLSALQAAHAIGIVHRDVKPDNILLTANGHAKVLDFGIAKLAPELSHAMSPRTRTGVILGTPSYMAPEQISGGGGIDARTDVYAAGVVLFEAVTGRLPFTGATLFDLMRAHVDDLPPAPRGLRADLPAAIEAVILTALAKSPEERFQSAAAMAAALDNAARSPRDTPRPAPPRSEIVSAVGEVPTVRVPRRSWRPPVIAVGLLAGAAGAVAVALSAPRDEAAPPATAPAPAGPVAPARVAAVRIDAAVAPAPVAADAAVVASAPADAAAVALGSSPARPPRTRPDAVREAPEVTPSAGIAVAVAPPADPPPGTAPTHRDPLHFKARFNARNFDYRGFLPQAAAFAHQLLPGARLFEMSLAMTYPDGHVDLTRAGYKETEFRFGVPTDGEHGCVAVVSLHPPDGVELYYEPNAFCSQTPTTGPHCPLTWMWQQGRAQGTTATEAGAMYRAGRWDISASDLSYTFDETPDCSAT